MTRAQANLCKLASLLSQPIVMNQQCNQLPKMGSSMYSKNSCYVLLSLYIKIKQWHEVIQEAKLSCFKVSCFKISCC